MDPFSPEQSGEPPLSLGLSAAAVAAPVIDPAAEFRVRLEALTPHVVVTPILIGLNVLVFLVMILSGVSPMQPTSADLLRLGGNFGPSVIIGREWWRMVTSMFLHIGILHLAFNMFVLWDAGQFVERLLGNLGFVLVYLVSGLAGALLSLAWHPYVISAGASGAIFGLYGALLGFIVWRRDSIPADVLGRLTKGALLFVGINAVYGFAHSGTDVADHVGGLICGFLCGLALSVPLTGDVGAARTPREIAVAVVALLALGAGAAALPRPVDFQAEMKTFSNVEKQTLAAYQTSMLRVRMEHLSDQQAADLIDKNVLPGWVAEHDRLAALRGLPDRTREILSRLLHYMDVRRQGWSAMSAGLRKHDLNAVRQGVMKQAEAAQLAKQIVNPAPEPSRGKRSF